MSARSGVTLLELIVAIALLSVLAGVSGLAVRGARPVTGPAAAVAAALAARDSALRSGHVVTIVVRLGVQPLTVTAYPDGRVLTDPALGIDPLSGRVPHATR